MELLKQLEERITALLNELDAVKSENERLKSQEQEAFATLAEEKASLQELLIIEQQRNLSARAHIESLIERIKERVDK